MLAPSTDDTQSASVDATVRGACIHRMEKNLLGALTGYIAACWLTWFLFRADWSGVLLPWAIASSIICLLRLAYAVHHSLGPVRPQSRMAIHVHAVADIALALAMSGGPIIVLFVSEGWTSTYMALAAASIMWAGALVHLCVFPVAATFIVVQMLMWLTGTAWAGWSIASVSITMLFLTTSVIGLVIGYRLSEWLADGLRQKLEFERQAVALRRQADTISLLLRQHEDETSDWLWQVDASGRLCYVSARFAAAFERSEEDLAGAHILKLFANAEIAGNADACRQLAQTMEEKRSFRDLIVPIMVSGEKRWWSVSGRPETETESDGRAPGYRGVMSDVTAEQQARAQISYLADHDPLTDLPIRRRFVHLAEGAFKRAPAGTFAILYIDLDGFKLANDRYGHGAGDQVLKAVAERLSDATRAAGNAARLSGDEFAVLIPYETIADLEDACRALIADLQRPIATEAVPLRIGASMGIALWPRNGTTPDALLRSADSALYRAKDDGRNTFRFYSAALDAERQERANLRQDLRDALPDGELELEYQPFIDVASGRVRGYEALLRWNHPQRGRISPMDFIPLAEESGLIGPIGRWVLETACAEARTWEDGRYVAVNVSPMQFREGDLPEMILSVLQKTGLEARRLEIEVTESLLLEDTEQAFSLIRRVRALGVSVSLDDFGTGYSSLSYLRCFAFDRIKIDRAFVSDLEQQRDSVAIVRAVASIGRDLGMKVTAEGVETTGQATALRELGCHTFQGYLYGRPQPATRIAHRTMEGSRLTNELATKIA